MIRNISRRSSLKCLLGGTAFVAGLSSACRSPFDGEISSTEKKAMAESAQAYRQQFSAPGLSVAIARHGRIAYAEAFGQIGHGFDAPLTTENLFRIASVSKPITSTAIFLLVEQGKLRLDDTVIGNNGLLGTQYGTRPYGPGIERITIDHLLTHTSGGWDPGHDPMFAYPELSQADLISWALDTIPLQNSPGAKFAYSNFGYCLLGRIIEKVSGQSYRDFVKQNVLQPSGATDMSIAGNSIAERAPSEVFYYGQTLVPGEQHYDDPYALNVQRMDSHGGWIASPSDLVRFSLHLDGPEASGKILRAETVALMTTRSPVAPNYARGWAVNDRGNRWHSGDLGGTSAILVRTAGGFHWAALTNTRCARSAAALDDLVWEMARKVRAWQSALG